MPEPDPSSTRPAPAAPQRGWRDTLASPTPPTTGHRRSRIGHRRADQHWPPAREPGAAATVVSRLTPRTSPDAKSSIPQPISTTPTAAGRAHRAGPHRDHTLSASLKVRNALLVDLDSGDTTLDRLVGMRDTLSLSPAPNATPRRLVPGRADRRRPANRLGPVVHRRLSLWSNRQVAQPHLAATTCPRTPSNFPSPTGQLAVAGGLRPVVDAHPTFCRLPGESKRLAQAGLLAVHRWRRREPLVAARIATVGETSALVPDLVQAAVRADRRHVNVATATARPLNSGPLRR